MGKKKDQQPISNKDINDIFKSIKKQNNTTTNNNKSDQPKKESKKQEQQILKQNKSQSIQNHQKQPKQQKHSNQSQNKTKYTEEGYKVYSTDDLKIGKGGNTDQCPFDCECCF